MEPEPADNLGAVEHRSCARLAFSSLIFVKMGDENGGIAFNVSEGGLALSAANGLPDGEIPDISIQLGDSGDWIRTAGQVTWRSNSKKEGGIRFVSLGEDDRQKIRQLIASEMSNPVAPDPEDHWACQNSELESAGPSLGDTLVSVMREDKPWADTAPAAEPENIDTVLGMQPDSEAGADAPVFTKEDEERAVAARRMPPSLDLPDNSYFVEAVLDRRVHARKRILPLGYVQLADNNGGITLNVSEGGLCITTAHVLLEDRLPSIRLQISDDGSWVNVKGEVVWRSESKKEVGLRFVDLPEQARLQIRTWLLPTSPPIEVGRQTELNPRSGNDEFPLPALSAPEPLHVEPIPYASLTEEAIDEISASPRITVSEDLSCVSSLPTSDSSVETCAHSQPVRWHHWLTREWIKTVGEWENAGMVLRASIATVTLLLLLGLAPLVREWFSFQPQGTKRMVASGQRQKAVETNVGDVVPQPLHPNVVTPPQPQQAEAPQEINGNLTFLNNRAIEATAMATLNDSPDRVKAASRPLAPAVSKESVPTEEGSHELSQSNTVSSAPLVPATKPTPPGEQPPVVSAPPVAWLHEEARLAPALIPVISAARNAEATGSEKSTPRNAGQGLALPKSTEPAPLINGTVAITTDPYPSIRFSGQPDRKKSRIGTRLQLGQLVSRVEPGYPEEAMQKGIQGTVRMHVIVSRDGSVESLVNVDGPPLLVPATLRAVQKWRYSQTLLGGRPVETEDNIAVTFGLTN